MGNHEFCTECGANDFHNGFPCDPERKVKWVAEQAAQSCKVIANTILLTELQKYLKEFGIKAEIAEYKLTVRGNAVTQEAIDRLNEHY